MTGQPSEQLTLLGVIQPINGNNATTLSGAVPVQGFHEFFALLQMGVIDQTVDFKLREASSSGGTYADISGKAVTQFTATDDGKSAIINLKAEELLTTTTHIKASVTISSGTSSLVSVAIFGIRPKYGPANDDKLSTLAQVIT